MGKRLAHSLHKQQHSGEVIKYPARDDNRARAVHQRRARVSGLRSRVRCRWSRIAKSDGWRMLGRLVAVWGLLERGQAANVYRWLDEREHRHESLSPRFRESDDAELGG